MLDFFKWVKSAILDKHFLYSLAVFFCFVLLFGIDIVTAYADFFDDEHEVSYVKGIASFMMIFFIGVIIIRFYYDEETLKQSMLKKNEINLLLNEPNFLKFYIKLWSNEKIEQIWILPQTLFFGWLCLLPVMLVSIIIMLPFLLIEFYFDFGMIEDIRTMLNSGIINI